MTKNFTLKNSNSVQLKRIPLFLPLAVVVMNKLLDVVLAKVMNTFCSSND